MSRKLYKRVAPHNQRVTADGGVATNNMSDLLLLQRSNEELKDYLKVAFCPELYGNKIRTSGINNFITKGYSANSIERELGEELHKRLTIFFDHMERLGRNLGSSVDTYNKALGSLERSVLPSVRRLAELGVSSGRNLQEPNPIESVPRPPYSKDLENDAEID